MLLRASRQVVLFFILSGSLVAQIATTTRLLISPDPAVSGAPSTLVAKVAPSAASGQVVFYSDHSVLGATSVLNGVAKLVRRMSGRGRHLFVARYSGSTNFRPSNSAIVTQALGPSDFVRQTPKASAVPQLARTTCRPSQDSASRQHRCLAQPR